MRTVEERKRDAREFQARRRKRLNAEGLCGRCGGARDVPSRKECSRCRKKLARLYRDRYQGKRIASHRVAQQALKREVFSKYGGAHCACCPESHMEFLSVDHIDGNGAAHRRAAFGHNSGNLYQLLKREGYPPGYRVLCMNCNWSRGRYGYCPHEKEPAPAPR